MRIPEPNDMDPTAPQTEDAAERGFVEKHDAVADPASYRDLGKTHTLDEDDIGDIADEGPGHRG